jgi:selenocysteine lyase/cysteine desulfurase
MHRRTLLQSGAAALIMGSAAPVARAAQRLSGRTAGAVVQDEEFWLAVQQAFVVDSRYILLNAGGSNPCPVPVHQARQRYHDHVNASPNLHSLRTGLPETLRTVRARLARHLNVDPAEVALTRNTTEGISIFVNSLHLKPGDEILCSSDEYHVTKAALRIRERRDGVRVVQVDVPAPATSHAEIVDAYRRGFTPRTKAVILCQILGVGGQIMPVREICAEARRRNVLSCVDGALGFGHVVTDLQAMGCDYYATSLHKYLSAPLGTGLFYVRKPLIGSTWPLFGLEEGAENRMTKFEHVGTRSTADLATVGNALDFYEAVGPARKQARLHYLKSYWMRQLKGEPRLRFSVRPEPEHSCASAIVAVEGMSGDALNKKLADEHGIWCFGGIKAGSVEGVYVAPNLFNTPAHLDALVAALRKIARASAA